MTTFRDAKGMAWEINLTWGLIQTVMSRHAVDLLGIDANSYAGLVRLSDDPLLLTSVAFTLIEAQANQRGVKLDEFRDAILGDEILGVVTAITTEVGRFFPQARRMALASFVSANVEGAEQLTSGMASLLTKERITTLTKERVGAVLRQMERALNDSISESPVRSESIPTTTAREIYG